MTDGRVIPVGNTVEVTVRCPLCEKWFSVVGKLTATGVKVPEDHPINYHLRAIHKNEAYVEDRD